MALETANGKRMLTMKYLAEVIKPYLIVLCAARKYYLAPISFMEAEHSPDAVIGYLAIQSAHSEKYKYHSQQQKQRGSDRPALESMFTAIHNGP